MRDLIEAAVASAASHGVQAAVVVLGGQAQVIPPVAAPAAGVTDEEARQRLAALQEQMAATARQRDEALQQVEQLSTRLRETQAEVAAARQTSAADTPPPPPPSEQPTNVVDYDSMSIDQLNLPEKVIKACGKQDIATIGQLRAQFGGSLKDVKLSQKERLATAEALMGYVQGPPPAAPAPTPVAPASTGDSPEGFTDRPWSERIKIARFKETKAAEAKDRLVGAFDAAQQHVAELPDPNTVRGEQFYAQALSALVSTNSQDGALALANYLHARSVHEVTNGQHLGLLYCCGFDPKQASQRTVDGGLTENGLAHLSEAVPAAAGA